MRSRGNSFQFKVQERFLEVIEHSFQTGFRHLFIIGSNSFNKSINCIEEFLKLRQTSLQDKNAAKKNLDILICHENGDDISPLLDVISGFGQEVVKVNFKNVRKMMGSSCDLLIVDLRTEFTLTALNILVESVRAGGWIFLIIDEINAWKKKHLFFDKHLQGALTEDDFLKNRFKHFFLEKSRGMLGISIVDLDSNLMVSTPLLRKVHSTPEKCVRVPSGVRFHSRYYRFARTQDQVEAFLQLERLIMKPTSKKRIFFVSSDRGRGKSAFLGIAAVALADYLRRKKRTRIVIAITAPEKSNYRVLLSHLHEVLRETGEKFTVKFWKRKQDISREMQIEDIMQIQWRNVSFKIQPIVEIETRLSDLLIIDEVAGIPFQTLKRAIQQSPIVLMASTVHGYEGVGRMFSLKFIPYLKNKKFELLQKKLKTPIRYNDGDPVESWLHEISFLKPRTYIPSLSRQRDFSSEITFEKLDLDACFLKLFEQDFKQFIGNIVTAHYRNNPDDVLRLADSDLHEAWTLKDNKSGISLVSIHSVIEGGLGETVITQMHEGKNFPGNILPWIASLYFRDAEFPQLSGLRIVRIATCPELTGQGFGSQALKGLEDHARKKGHDWIGTSFGVTHQLFRFWRKSGFLPFHLSPRITPSTGEHSIFFIKPISDRGQQIISRLVHEFKIRFFDWIRHVFYDINAELIDDILESLIDVRGDLPCALTLSPNQMSRLNAYLKKQVDDIIAIDAILSILRSYYWQDVFHVSLSPVQKSLIIKRFLQARTWQQTVQSMNLRLETAQGMLRKAVKKINSQLLDKLNIE
ncbi:MAG: GNAT family N-acetyltransferase [Candidatus Helarchaeota archaeon]